MDLNTVAAIERPRERGDIRGFRDGDAWLAGGTWLFSEPQPTVTRLIDLDGFGWEPLRADPRGLTIGATCKIATLHAFDEPDWPATRLIDQCCRAFLASFKIWNMATVGGNICCALPAGPMISLCAALDGVCVIWGPGGAERRASVFDFVEGPLRPALKAGEVLRSVEIPAEALRRRTAFRQISLTKLGRSGALLIGSISAKGGLDLTVTAATRRPLRISFDRLPGEAELNARVAAEIPDTLYYNDIHGRPDWRKHMTFEFSREIRRELAQGATP
jgi:CO/xanthine dehydrogenase FAD-binding subunit